MFSKNSIIALTILIVAISAHNLAFDLRSIKYTKGNDFWSVDVPCSGGSGQYNYEYDLPTGWKYEGNRIKIPATATQQTSNQYVVRCKVRDSTQGDILERSLVFKPFSQGQSYSLEVTDHDYFYGDSGLSTYSHDTSSIHGIDVLNRLGSLVQNAGAFNFAAGSGVNYNAGSAFYGSGSGSGYSGSGQYSGASSGNDGSGYSSYGSGSQSSYGSQTSGSSSYSQSSSYGSGSSSSSSSYNSGSSYGSGSSNGSGSFYSSLPSISQLEKYIYGGDIVEIIQTIQLVVDSKIKCDAKAAYLSDFLGRICAAIEVKKYALNDLKAIVTAAIAQIQKLTVQIQTIKTQ
jgi:hypothetical protein